MPPFTATIVGDGAAISLCVGVIHLVVTSTGRRSTGGSLSQVCLGSASLLCLRFIFLIKTCCLLCDVVRTRHGVIVLSIAQITHNSFRAIATIASGLLQYRVFRATTWNSSSMTQTVIICLWRSTPIEFIAGLRVWGYLENLCEHLAYLSYSKALQNRRLDLHIMASPPGNLPGESILFAVRPADSSCGNSSRLPLQFGGDQLQAGRVDFANFECWQSRGAAGAPLLTPLGEARSPIFAPARSKARKLALDLNF
jgi:hypothetical protein